MLLIILSGRIRVTRSLVTNCSGRAGEEASEPWVRKLRHGESGPLYALFIIGSGVNDKRLKCCRLPLLAQCREQLGIEPHVSVLRPAEHPGPRMRSKALDSRQLSHFATESLIGLAIKQSGEAEC